jgi:hypothetical protein
MPGEEIEAHRRSEPRGEGLERVARLLGADGPGGVYRLKGGAACAVHRVELLGGQCPQVVVVKRFPSGVGTPRFEWEALGAARRAPIPSPEPLAFDPDGEWFATPAIVMSCLPGQLVLTPGDAQAWTGQLAAALAAIHSTPADDLPAFLARPAIWDRWTPDGLPDDARGRDISAGVSGLRTKTWEIGFCHGDFHPGNVLFDSGGLAGVVDWASARSAPVLSDIGRCRGALAVWPGGEAPELFREHYARLSGRSLDGLAYWDLMAGAVTLRHGGDRTAVVYQDQGVDISGELIVQRAASFVDAALGQLEGVGDQHDR